MALIDTIRSAAASADNSIITGEPETLQLQAETIAKTVAKKRSRKADKPVPTRPAAMTPKKPSASAPSKTDIVLKKLHLVKGVTIAQLVETTGWQAHSVRGFLSAVIRKKLGLMLVSEIGKDGIRRYRIEAGADDKAGRAG